ncbi:dihydroneopterin aldolase [Eilatimonas milleporae]|uniref:7,8-dihydroneopterin aldolase n=1 Tax=Eilatimonas milleporae TaxID=911205 RepID=A0A3M0CR15_9PROT|nr:dihydroneopterin aldolase [Eilatimonas milleporae]RMB12004.1 dihydroneopterin aldolase [Eilatimonas milleporae]
MADDDLNRATIVPLPARPGLRRVFVRNYTAQARIGVWDHEKQAPQPVRISVDLSVLENGPHHGDELDGVVCYQDVVDTIDFILAGGHIQLVETLAERIAEQTLCDRRVVSVRVMVEKTTAVDGADSVGVEIERHRRA